MPDTYSPYYLRHILNNDNGFKPVIGGTGLGKTNGMIEAIKESINKGFDRKFVYITNRHLLIGEVEKELNAKGIPCVYMRSQNESLLNLVNPENDKLTTILQRLAKKGFFKYDNDWGGKNSDELQEEINFLIENIKNNYKLRIHADGARKRRNLDSSLNELNRFITNQFYKIKQDKTLLESLLVDNDVWKLFPYIEYERNPEIKVLLGTIKKFCYGFFDGQRKRKLPYLRDRVIFLDEFDFLESEILKVLCEENFLDNPVSFVKIFLNRFEKIKSSDFWEKSKLVPLQRALEHIFNQAQEDSKRHNINFPTLEDFTFSDTYTHKRLVVFQTEQTILSKDFYLKQTPDAWEITEKKAPNNISPKVLFRIIKEATKNILEALGKHINSHSDAIGYIINFIWNSQNDYKKGAYDEYISDVMVYKDIQLKDDDQKTDFSYIDGFSLIEIEHKNNINPLEAQLNPLELAVSAEAIIKKIASQNLIFALSATSDIPRVVNCFNEKWLKKYTPFISPNSDDIALIRELKRQKDSKRENKIEFTPNELLDKSNVFSKYINDLHQDGFFDEKNSTEEGAERRKERVLKFFGCLNWIVDKSKGRTHLIFLTSFRHINDILGGNHMQDHISQKVKSILDPSNLHILGNEKKAYQVVWNNKKVNIILLNAEQAKVISEKESEFNAVINDEQADKVILLTQYATASNGVNLGFKDKAGEKKDFEGIHLLESRFYWFDTDNNNKEASRKVMFWYMWKLMDNQDFSRSRFEWYLQQSNIEFINGVYLNKTMDSIYNQIALFHQALGRVERQWTKHVLTEITLGVDVISIFRTFFGPDYQENINIKERECYTATIILQLNAQLQKHLKTKELFAKLYASKQNIQGINHKSILFTGLLLDEIEQIKKGEYRGREIEAREIIKIWLQIRKAVLQSDAKAALVISPINAKKLGLSENLFEFQNTYSFATSLINSDGSYYLTLSDEEDNFTIYKDYQIGLSCLREINPNSLFAQIRQNSIISTYFKERDYVINFSVSETQQATIFTPYIVQAILKGAIGEESIKALLANKNIYMEDDDNSPIELFEVFDSKIQGLPIYIDFKNFSNSFIDSFAIQEDDPLYEEKYTSEKFLKKVAGKLQKIRQHQDQEQARYVVIQLCSRDGFQNTYYTHKLKRVNYISDADIIVIPSAIKDGMPNDLGVGFIDFVKYVQTLQKTLLQ